jgi:2-polyprenyl-3-methyl-5-hydroxy-6-metoxy-1,4-benzoquinol methylase
MHNHDISDGPLLRCQVCGSERLELVIDLGHQPLSDSLPSKEELNQPETTYPLRQMWCRDCTLSQLDYVVPGGTVYHPDYPYRSGITKELATYQDALAGEAIEKLALPADSLVVDIGSNDGTLLKGFQRRGMRVLGVEPTNIARIANEDGVETLQAFFNEETARQIVETRGKAKLATATNVFAHMATLGAFLRGLNTLLADDGVFMLENHYLVEIMRGGQFDTIYHEHLRSYSLKSIVALFDQYDFTVLHARQVDRYGGNIRVFVGKGRGRNSDESVAAILKMEEEFGLSDPACYAAFRKRGEAAKNALAELAISCRQKDIPFVGNSCPARASTLLNYAGIGKDLMPYIAEQPTSLKLGKHLPGKHIPIVENSILIEEQPEYVVLLAWHYWKPISEQLRARGLRSKMVVPLPEMHILED